MKIGFLPLYIKLYDDIGSDRTYLEEVYGIMADMFKEKGVEVITSNFCRIKPEFDAAIAAFEAENVDAIVTWHAAYSPSLESLESLTKTKLPIVVLDTTPTLEFSPKQDPSHIGANHGIHGVMDMCSMLKQRGKAYAIAAGHYTESNVIDRACSFVRSAIAAKALSTMKVGLVGGGFHGMGDFAVAPEELKERFGITVETIAPEILEKANQAVSAEAVAAEIALDKSRFTFGDDVVDEEYEAFMKSCLALRAHIEKEQYTAFSVNFLNVEGLGTMPFVECCKAMERGLGYAGEGDALTAAFTGAFLKVYPETSFVEIFCPDWNNNMVFLSHMGEMNYRIADGTPVIHRTNSSYVKGNMPYAGYSKMKAGKGVYVNVSREKDDYQLLLSSCEMLPAGDDNFTRAMRGWMKPEKAESTAEFLETLSQNGATHHSTFVYGATVEELAFFGKLLSMKTLIV